MLRTGLIDDLNTGPGDSSPSDFLFMNHMLFFSSDGETGYDRELWMYVVP